MLNLTYLFVCVYMILYGKQVAKELKRAGFIPKRIWVKKSVLVFAKELFGDRVKDVRIVHPNIITKICGSEEHQGIAFEVNLKKYSLKDLHDIKKLVVFLDGVQDVGNIGNIIRTCEFFGCDAVIISEEGSPEISPQLIKASSGAFFHIKVIREKKKNVLDELKRRTKIYVFDLRGENSIFSTKFTFPATLCFGSEDKGVSQETLNSADFKVRIPQFGKVESLNVASSVAIGVFSTIFSHHIQENLF
jgi:tRNA G18 (ribose-2'-O)-methylase SpoU